jgi:hypothetical protein
LGVGGVCGDVLDNGGDTDSGGDADAVWKGLVIF